MARLERQAKSSEDLTDSDLKTRLPYAIANGDSRS